MRNEKIERLLKKAIVLLVISFFGILLVVRGEILGEKDILYVLGGIIGLSSAVFSGMICFYIEGFKDGKKVEKYYNREVKKWS